jgi:hypothetical protein
MSIQTGIFKELGPSDGIKGRGFLVTIGEYGGKQWSGKVLLLCKDDEGGLHQVFDNSRCPYEFSSPETVSIHFHTFVTLYLECTSLNSGYIPWTIGL